MGKRQKIRLELIENDSVDSTSIPIHLEEEDLLEPKGMFTGIEAFSSPYENNFNWSSVRRGVGQLMSPIIRSPNVGKFIVIAIIRMVTSIPIIRKLAKPFMSPLLRGWRLEVVRRVALNLDRVAPSVDIGSLVKYFIKGIVLSWMRWIYFLPLIIVTFLMSLGNLKLLKEIFYFVWDKWWNAESMGYVEYFAVKVLPQAGIDFIIELILVGFYVLLVWPIYRLIMIQYALRLTSWSDFLNLRVIKNSIALFYQHSSLIYGIYGLIVVLDIVVFWVASILFVSTVGLILFFLPIYYLFFRYWIKGYAYGLIGQRLIDSNAFPTLNYNEPIPNNSEDDSPYV